MQDYTARGANTRRAKTAEHMAANPIVRAAASDDEHAVLHALRTLAIINHCGCWIVMPRTVEHDGFSIYDRDGYRYTNVDGKMKALHRLSLEARLGTTLGRMHAHHACAVRSCCNPEHLQVATAIENNLEMIERVNYRQRIADLEQALNHLDPDHPLLLIH